MSGYTTQQMIDIADRTVCHLRSPEDREDAKQEFILGMLEAEQKAENPATLKSYEWSSGRGRLLSFLARQKKYNFAHNRPFDSDEILLDTLDVRETPIEEATKQDQEEWVRSLVDGLLDKQNKVIRGRFFSGQTLEQVGKSMGYTKEGIRQIEEGALALLRRRAMA